MISPLYYELTESIKREKEKGDRSSANWTYLSHEYLAITDRNKCLIISYANSEDPRYDFDNYYKAHGDPKSGYLKILYKMKNTHKIKCKNIVKIRNGSILMQDNVVYSVRRKLDNRRRRWVFHKYPQIHDIVDIMPYSATELVFLTSSHQICSMKDDSEPREIYEIAKERTRPVKFLEYYLAPADMFASNSISRERWLHTFVVLGADGGIYYGNSDSLLESPDGMSESVVPRELLAARPVKSARNNLS